MRAIEFINEATDKLIKKSSRYALPHAKQMDDIDQYYGFYRLGIAMAGAPTHSAPGSGPAKDIPTLWPYSDGDEEIINKAIKIAHKDNWKIHEEEWDEIENILGVTKNLPQD